MRVRVKNNKGFSLLEIIVVLAIIGGISAVGIPNFIKWLRRSPLGNFMAFPIEMLRTSKNVLKQGYEDYTGKTAIKLGITDPKKIEKLKILGAKRLGSSIAPNTAGGIAMSASEAINN